MAMPNSKCNWDHPTGVEGRSEVGRGKPVLPFGYILLATDAAVDAAFGNASPSNALGGSKKRTSALEILNIEVQLAKIAKLAHEVPSSRDCTKDIVCA